MSVQSTVLPKWYQRLTIDKSRILSKKKLENMWIQFNQKLWKLEQDGYFGSQISLTNKIDFTYPKLNGTGHIIGKVCSCDSDCSGQDWNGYHQLDELISSIRNDWLKRLPDQLDNKKAEMANILDQHINSGYYPQLFWRDGDRITCILPSQYQIWVTLDSSLVIDEQSKIIEATSFESAIQTCINNELWY